MVQYPHKVVIIGSVLAFFAGAAPIGSALAFLRRTRADRPCFGTNPPSTKRHSRSLSHCTETRGNIPCSPILAMHVSTIHQEVACAPRKHQSEDPLVHPLAARLLVAHGLLGQDIVGLSSCSPSPSPLSLSPLPSLPLSLSLHAHHGSLSCTHPHQSCPR